MTAKTANWRPGPTVCRCCLAEGCYKDISTEYFWMGKREVYAEMLSDTFSVSISYSKSGGPNSNSRLICEPCISRLRDASEFRRQVLDCEKTFMQHLDPGSSSAELPEELASLDEVKVERVKIERDTASDDDFDTRADLLDDDDDDDDLDDQPLTKFASKVPKKELKEVSILEELLGNSEVSIKRKSSLKPKQSPTKKLKRSETVKATSSKALVKTIEKKKKDVILSMNSIRKRIAEVILTYSTVYPFRLPEENLLCVYCEDDFKLVDHFRQHLETEHRTAIVKTAVYHVKDGYLKADCSNIKCRICKQHFETVEEIATHLKTIHNKNIDLTIPSLIQPFNLDTLTCVRCNKRALSIRSLSRHMQSHYADHTCETCGKSYSSKRSLYIHNKYSHAETKHICRKCKLKFNNNKEKTDHLYSSEKCRLYVCSMCYGRFVTVFDKKTHVTQVHGLRENYKCPDCELEFTNKRAWNRHFVLNHTDDTHICSSCGVKFGTACELSEHVVKHTNEKPFVCNVCDKAFSRKKNLQQHSWIHNEIKRFKCDICEKKFNQRVTWKIHMKSNHPELEIT